MAWKYEITIPVKGYYTIEVEVDSGIDPSDGMHDADEELAQEMCGTGEFKLPDGILPTENWEWEIYKPEVTGT